MKKTFRVALAAFVAVMLCAPLFAQPVPQGPEQGAAALGWTIPGDAELEAVYGQAKAAGLPPEGIANALLRVPTWAKYPADGDIRTRLLVRQAEYWRATKVVIWLCRRMAQPGGTIVTGDAQRVVDLLTAQSSPLMKEIEALKGEIAALRQDVQRIPSATADEVCKRLSAPGGPLAGLPAATAQEVVRQLIDPNGPVMAAFAQASQAAVDAALEKALAPLYAEVRAIRRSQRGEEWRSWVTMVASVVGGVYSGLNYYKSPAPVTVHVTPGTSTGSGGTIVTPTPILPDPTVTTSRR